MGLDPGRHAALMEVFEEVCDLAPEARDARLAELCVGERADLLPDLERLLGEDDSTQVLVDRPPSSLAAEALGAGIPERVGPYRVLSLLGEGGMGVVVEAEQTEPRRRVALKLLRRGPVSRDVERRFEHEAELLGRLRHPAIAQVYEAGVAEGLRFIAMERVEGMPLDEFARGLPLTRVLALVARVCDGVQHAHQNGVVHRDLKPANVLVEADGTPKILDFGVGRALDDEGEHTLTGQLVGTVAYMSPEQVRGEPREVDSRCDVYALGVVLYRLLAKRAPLELTGVSMFEAVQRILETEPRALRSVAPDVPADVAAIVHKALAKEKERRYAAAAELAADLRRFVAGEPVEARAATTLYVLGKFTKRHRALVVSVVAFVAALVAGLVGTGRGFVRASAEADRANKTAAFFQEILAGVDPAVAQGTDTELLKLILDDTAARIDDELAGQPMIEATILDTMTTAYFAIGAYEAALEQARRASMLFERERGADSTEFLSIQRATGTIFTRLGDYEQAESTLLECLASCERAFGDEHLITHAARSELGSLYLRLERGDAAADLFERVYAYRQGQLGSEHNSTLIGLEGLGLARLMQSRFEEGEALLTQVLETRRRIYGEAHPQTIIALHNLAGAITDQDRFSDAEELYREALEDYGQILGPQHPTTVQGQRNLGMLLRSAGRYDEAAELQRTLLEDALTRFGPEDSRTYDAEQSLAVTYRFAGKFQEAEPLARHALAGRTELYGETHPRSLVSMSSLLFVLDGLGNTEEADPIRARILDLYRDTLGDEDPSTLLIQHNIATYHIGLGQFDEAEPLARSGLEASRRLLGMGMATLQRVSALALVCHHTGRPAEAIPLQAEHLAGWTRMFGDEDPFARSTARDLDSNFERLVDLDAFEDELRTLLEYHRRVLTDGAPQLTRDLVRLGDALVDSGRQEEALECLEEALGMGTDDLPSARALSAYGAALAGLGQYDEAQDTLLAAWEAEARPDHRRKIAARMVDLNEASGRAADAQTWRERAADRE